jgi:hypothetical protein
VWGHAAASGAPARQGGGHGGAARLHGRERQRKKEEKRWGKRRADRRVPHVSGCGVWLVVSGLAGCVGPKGLVGCGLGEAEEGFEVV